MNNRRKTIIRIASVAVIFVLVCLVFIIKMINVTLDASPNKIITGTYERREPITALRGQIYDRNGKALVYNEYSYDLVFDYDAMAATNLDRNYAILQVVYALKNTGKLIDTSQRAFGGGKRHGRIS